MQTIVTDVRGVCRSVCHAVRGSFGAAFAKPLRPLVTFTRITVVAAESKFFYRTNCNSSTSLTQLCTTQARTRGLGFLILSCFAAEIHSQFTI